MPRWAVPLGEPTWRRINEMLDDGHYAASIMRELSIPPGKKRSLELYASTFGPRRRLIAWAAFKDALLFGTGDLGEDFMKGLGCTLALAISGKTDPAVQVRAMREMNGFMRALGKLMEADAEAEEKRKTEETIGEKVKRAGAKLSKEAMDAIRKIYNLPVDGDDGDG